MSGIDSLPIETILEQLLLLDHKTLLKTCSTNKQIKQICDNYQNTLYKNLIKKDFGIKEFDPKMIYMLLDTARSTDRFFDKNKHFELIMKNVENPRKLKKLVKYINIDSRDNNGNTPDINAQNNIGDTVLTIAIKKQLPEIINRILDLKPNVNLQTNSGDTALTWALTKSTPEIINKILDLKPDINIKNNDGNTVLMFALATSTPEIINRILELNPKVNTVNTEKNTPLLLALKKKVLPEIIKKILNLFPDINITDSENWTPLMHALKNYGDDKEISNIFFKHTKKYSTPEIQELIAKKLNI